MMQTTAEQPVASFVARLMSLNAHELQCLHADPELMRHLTHTHLLMESRLRSASLESKLLQQQQQQQQMEQQHHYHQFIQQQQQQQLLLSPTGYHHYYLQHQLPAGHALDLRTTPTGLHQLRQQPDFAGHHHHHLYQAQLQLGSARSSSSNSSCSSSADGSIAAANTAPPTATRALNPKKVKLTEYQRQQGATNSANLQQQQQQHHHQTVITTTQAPPGEPPAKRKAPAPKKYKGEFDEPTPAELEQRQLALTSATTNYHGRLAPELRHLGECACVLGSVFHDNKPVARVLDMIDQWRRLPAAQRASAKWDVNDLPKDIPLADIKKYEDLRRLASGGRADFGGASKRKPLGIRGTRQFLLILYCLWGHPGRDDVMQRDGYCPHCFAKIKKANEQSTLVRVVNHFNMKHRKGANPRLSPHRDIPAAAPDSHLAAQQLPQSSDSQQQGGGQLFADLMLLAAAASPPCRSPESGGPTAAKPTSTTSPSATPEPHASRAECQSSSSQVD